MHTVHMVAVPGVVELPARMRPAGDLDHRASGLPGADPVIPAEGVAVVAVPLLTAYARQRLAKRSSGRALTPGLNAPRRRGPPDGR